MIWLKRTAAFLLCTLVLLALIAGGIYIWLQGSLPKTSGEIAVAGSESPLTIHRDARGVVRIEAANKNDAHFALGFAHAQDRFAQMEFTRRLADGRLSELIGRRGARSDRILRTLGFRLLAEAAWPNLPPEIQKTIEAYAAGVNAYLSTREGPLPPELALLGGDPEPWTPIDSLVIGRALALQLSGNWQDEIKRQALSRKLSPEALEDFWPAMPAADRADAGGDPFRAASNVWAVGGRLTRSGRPLLANDPHLPFEAPIQWYLARLEAPNFKVAGGTMPGIPFVLVGHNGQVAWGVTTTHADTQDLFIEHVVDDGINYETPDGPRAFAIRDEKISVRFGDDIAMKVRGSRHGPMLSDSEFTDRHGADGRSLALAWTCLAPGDRTPVALYNMNRAQDAAEFRAALGDFHCPVQTIAYADVAGAIGTVVAGRVPVRKSLHAGSQAPVEGSSGAFDWTGFVPTEALPGVGDPPSGWVGAANGRPEGNGSSFLAARWEPSYRYRRIAQRLDAKSGLTADDMASIQLDTLSLLAGEQLPVMLANVVPLGRASEAAVAALRDWNFQMTRDRAAPLIFTAWLNVFHRLVFGDELGDLYDAHAPDPLFDAARLFSDRPGAPDWCDNGGTPAHETCVTLLSAALADAVASLAEAHGDDQARWRWGDAHEARFASRVWSQVPLLGRLLTRSIAVDGAADTLNRAVSWPSEDGASFTDGHGPGLRMIVDLADIDASRFIIATGQSGNPLSPHFDDLIAPWRDGRYLSMLERPAASLRLVPRAP